VRPPYGRFLDIGCGTGALSFLLLAGDPAATGVGVELQPELAELAARGRDDNGWRDRLEIRVGDVRQMGPAVGQAGFDLVATNPPFRSVREGSPSPHLQRALSNHEIALTLTEWLDRAAAIVRPSGRVAAIFPAGRADELLREMRIRRLQPARVRHVHPRAGQPALRVLVEAVRGGQQRETLEPPLTVHGDGARFSSEVLQMLGEA
jgi:tRNA1(Val) A37 N6-methylase TrmN6